jgi:hypothetical protein
MFNLATADGRRKHDPQLPLRQNTRKTHLVPEFLSNICTETYYLGAVFRVTFLDVCLNISLLRIVPKNLNRVAEMAFTVSSGAGDYMTNADISRRPEITR